MQPLAAGELSTQLGCDSAWFLWFSLTFPVGVSLWDEHPPFVAPLLARFHPSHPDPRGSGGKAGADVDCRVKGRLFLVGLSAPIPGHRGDRECLVLLHQHCRKVGKL